jgi:acetyl esterase/lipase
MSEASERSRGATTLPVCLGTCWLVVTLSFGCGGEDGPGPDTDSGPTDTASVRASQPDANPTEPEVTSTGEPSVVSLDDGSTLCTPPGAGPFPGVLYNHGGRATVVGGDLEGTCLALAEAGYVGYSKARRLGESRSIAGHIDDVHDGLDALLAADGVDTSRVAIMGFSRGGLLTLQAATERPDTFSAVVTMAPASAKGLLATVLEDAGQIDAPVLVLVSDNDLFQDDHVALAQEVVDALEAEDEPVEHIVYGPFGDDGHERFFTVGSYWDDVTTFLEANL